MNTVPNMTGISIPLDLAGLLHAPAVSAAVGATVWASLVVPSAHLVQVPDPAHQWSLAQYRHFPAPGAVQAAHEASQATQTVSTASEVMVEGTAVNLALVLPPGHIEQVP